MQNGDTDLWLFLKMVQEFMENLLKKEQELFLWRSRKIRPIYGWLWLPHPRKYLI